MKQMLLSILLLACVTTFAQKSKWSDREIEKKLDSIKQEGSLLYALENASWNATDLLRERQEVEELAGMYLTYKSKDTVKTVFLNKNTGNVLVEYSFLNDSRIPIAQKVKDRKLNAIETDLKAVRENLASQLSDPKYEVGVPEGFSLNLVTIPFGEKYKTYLITGAHETGVIPFGNDYLFVTDKAGNIVENKKFHSKLIPLNTSESPGVVVSAIHSHLKTSPFMAATDICTFKLYARFTKLDKFAVYSPALKTYFEYDYKKDTLKKVKEPF